MTLEAACELLNTMLNPPEQLGHPVGFVILTVQNENVEGQETPRFNLGSNLPSVKSRVTLIQNAAAAYTGDEQEVR